MIRRQLRRYYKYLLSRVVFRQVVSDSNWAETCQRIRFDNFGESVILLFRFMFFKSDVYLGPKLLGFFFMGGAGGSLVRRITCVALVVNELNSRTYPVEFVRQM